MKMDIDILIEKILSQKASKKEIEEFDAWLKEADTNREYFEKTKTLWKGISSVYNGVEFDKAAAKEKIRHHIQIKSLRKRRFHLRITFSAAASILLLVGLWYFTSANNKNYTLYSSSNTIKEVFLPDSSVVWLNKNSSVAIAPNFNKRDRKVILTGEAYFRVQPNPTKPFKIAANKTITKVLGTSFNVEMNEQTNNVSLSVNSGKVAFYRKLLPLKPQILQANDKAIFIAETKSIERSTIANENYISWRTGILTFNDTPLEEVCLLLSKHFSKEIILTTPLLRHEALTGRFDNENLEDILLTIELTLDVKTTISDRVIKIYN